MKTLNLTKTQQLQIEAFSLMQTGNIAAIRSWGRIIDAAGVGAEQKTVLSFSEVQGGYVWVTPDDSVQVEVLLQPEDATRLLEGLEGFAGWSVKRDAAWLYPLIEQLKG